MLRSALTEGRPLSLDSDTLMIGFDREFEHSKESADTPRSHQWLQNTLRHLTSKAMNVKIVFADDPSIPSGEEPSATRPQNQEPSKSSSNAGSGGRNDPPSGAASTSPRFEDDPMIQKALEIFKGEIVNIKR